MKGSKVLLNILSVVCFIYGALYAFTLVFIPIGIYCFIAGRRFSCKADALTDTTAVSNRVFRNYVIFVSIFCFPFGLLSVIPYLLLSSNNISVSSAEAEPEIKVIDADEKTETLGEETKQEQEAEVDEPETEEEKREKYEKLKSFNEKGFITDDELSQAHDQLFGKKDKE